MKLKELKVRIDKLLEDKNNEDLEVVVTASDGDDLMYSDVCDSVGLAIRTDHGECFDPDDPDIEGEKVVELY